MRPGITHVISRLPQWRHSRRRRRQPPRCAKSGDPIPLCFGRAQEAPQGGHMARIARVIAQGYRHHIAEARQPALRDLWGRAKICSLSWGRWAMQGIMVLCPPIDVPRLTFLKNAPTPIPSCRCWRRSSSMNSSLTNFTTRPKGGTMCGYFPKILLEAVTVDLQACRRAKLLHLALRRNHKESGLCAPTYCLSYVGPNLNSQNCLGMHAQIGIVLRKEHCCKSTGPERLSLGGASCLL